MYLPKSVLRAKPLKATPKVGFCLSFSCIIVLQLQCRGRGILCQGVYCLGSQKQ